MQTLGKLREQIDGVDAQIKQLLEKRFDISIEIGRVKKEAGMAVLDGRREDMIIDGIIGDKSLKHSLQIAGVYRAIMAGSKELQK